MDPYSSSTPFTFCRECQETTSGACWLHRPALVVISSVVTLPQAWPPSCLPAGEDPDHAQK
jgi:hypothetical protein